MSTEDVFTDAIFKEITDLQPGNQVRIYVWDNGITKRNVTETKADWRADRVRSGVDDYTVRRTASLCFCTVTGSLADVIANI